MKLGQLFWAAFFSRTTSLLSLGVFFYSMYADLEVRTSMMAIGLAFTGWIVGSFFLGLYQSGTTALTVAKLTAMDNVKELTDEKDEDDDEPNTSHPLFKDDNNE